ncbi:MAG: hypothetical protein ACYS8X_00530 [Planctomycetota bacterium]|jgi:hypothetical protein
MELTTVPDFPTILQRFEAWWQCEVLDRPLVSVGVPRKHEPRKAVATKTHPTLRDRWLDFEYELDHMEANLDGAAFAGDSLPIYYPNIGPEICATAYGCELEFSPGTSWSIPIVESCEDVLKLDCDLTTFYWKWLRDATDASLERGAGKWITGLPDLHTNGDLLASLLDPQQLALLYADDPAGVDAMCEHVREDFALMYDDVYNRIAAAGQPSTTWTPTLHMGKSFVLQCDFICMISPKDFQRTVLPLLEYEIGYLERSVYHLDGPGALVHLDALLETDLNAIQWVFGAGQGNARDWIDVYKRIQAAGKGVQIFAEDLAEAKLLAEHLKPEGVWLCMYAQHSQEEAEALLTWAERWAAGKA